MSRNQVILITGSRKGIGRKLAEHFLALNKFVIGCSRTESDLVHKNYTHFCLDVTDEFEVKKMFFQLRQDYQGLDVLINNAGVASMNHFILTPYSTVEKIFSTNLSGTFICSREASKIMQKKKYGRIINFSSVAVALNLEGEAIYAASKSAVEQLSKVMSKELGILGITVNCVAPTPIDTDLIKAVPKIKIDELISNQSIKRMGVFDDVINVIEFFIDEKSSFVSGQTIYLGGIMS